jgi:hypothetical protein
MKVPDMSTHPRQQTQPAGDSVVLTFSASEFYNVDNSLDINEVGSFQHALLCPVVVFLEE